MSRDLASYINARPTSILAKPQDPPLFLATVDALGWPTNPAQPHDTDRDLQGRRGGEGR